MNRHRALTWSLAALLAFLLWDFSDRALLYSPLSTSPIQTVTATDTGEKDEDKFEAAWGVEIVEKNLFNENRSERVSPTDSAFGINDMPDSDAATRGQAVRPEIILSGIIKNQFGERVAYLQIGKDDAVGARKGEAVQEFKVVDIQQRTVSLGWRGSTFELTLSSNPLIKR